MIHRAPFGSMERFVAVLTEHCAGKFPIWLAPEQVSILPVSDKFTEYSKKVADYLKNYDLRASVDERSEKIGKKIRDSELQKVPYMLIIGEKEETSSTVSVRKQGEGDLGVMTMEEFAKFLTEEVNKKILVFNS
jgi:threonyl-tRNA synthetase